MSRRHILPLVLLVLAAGGCASPAGPSPELTLHTAPEGIAALPPMPPLGGWRKVVDAFAASKLKHPAWGYAHSQRNYRLASALARQDGVVLDDDVLFAASYLHDIAAFPAYAKEGADHADRAAELVPQILLEAGFPMDKLPAVQSAIRTHMWFREPLEPAAIYLHDADGLDWLGAIGVARVTALVDAEGGSPSPAEAVAMLRQRLSEVPPTIRSRSGRMLLLTREKQLRTYLDLLSGESDGLRSL